MSKLKPIGVQELYAAVLKIYKGDILSVRDAVNHALEIRAEVEQFVERREAALAAEQAAAEAPHAV